MPSGVKKVFLSSTARDLAEYREAVAQAINRLDDHKCVRMEDFGSRDVAPDDYCRQRVGECDIYVGLFGHLYGSVPNGETRSFTEREYEAALACKMPRLLFLADEDFLLPRRLWEAASQSLSDLNRFHARVKRDRMASFFSFGVGAPQDLAAKVTAALYHLVFQSLSGVEDLRARSASASVLVDPATLELRYLDHLVGSYRYLDFRGIGPTDQTGLQANRRLELLDLYVPLQARCALPEGETWSRPLRLAGRRITEQEAAEVGGVGQPQPALGLLQKNAGIVLLGDPGAGKSTFLKYLALSFALGQGEHLGLGRRLPVLVPLVSYAEKLAAGGLRLDHFVADSFREGVGDLPIENLLEPALEEGRVLLLLDGLDEVRDPGLQRVVVQWVESFYGFHRKAGNKFVLTSRIVGYREVRPAAEGLVECTLVDFDDQEIETFLGRWVLVQERDVLGDSPAAKSSAERERRELLQALHTSAAVRSLAANPLLLTILALMKRQGVALPEQRARLYSVYVRTLLESWSAVRGLTQRPVRERNAFEVLKVLAPLALWMHETSPKAGLVRQRDLKQRLREIYLERGDADPEAAATMFLGDLHQSCLLLERGASQFGFLHLTFLEYLAAYSLAKLEQYGLERVLEEITPRIGDAAWKEVLLLTIGHLAAVDEREVAAGRLLLSLVQQRPGPPGEAVVLAGQALADLGRNALPVEVREKVVGVLLETMRDEETIQPARRAAAGRALAAIGDPRREVTTLEGMQFCWVPPGPFMKGSTSFDSQAENWEKPERRLEISYGYWIGRYPVTVAQLLEYVASSEAKLGDPDALRGDGNAPAVWASCFEAAKFCVWLTSEAQKRGWIPEGWAAMLPSDLEWEKAARGGFDLPAGPETRPWGRLAESCTPDSGRSNSEKVRRFPWGEVFDTNRANSITTGIGRPSAVGCFPGGASPLGVEEMSGNVWEWTRSLAHGYDAREEPRRFSGKAPVTLCGGSFLEDYRELRCAYRGLRIAPRRSESVGFRVLVRRL